MRTPYVLFNSIETHPLYLQRQIYSHLVNFQTKLVVLRGSLIYKWKSQQGNRQLKINIKSQTDTLTDKIRGVEAKLYFSHSLDAALLLKRHQLVLEPNMLQFVA